MGLVIIGARLSVCALAGVFLRRFRKLKDVLGAHVKTILTNLMWAQST